jgi:hypothetical protein
MIWCGTDDGDQHEAADSNVFRGRHEIGVAPMVDDLWTCPSRPGKPVYGRNDSTTAVDDLDEGAATDITDDRLDTRGHAVGSLRVARQHPDLFAVVHETPHDPATEHTGAPSHENHDET